MNLIYICVFHQESYINLLEVLIHSIYNKSNINKENTHILIITSDSFVLKIHEKIYFMDLPIFYYVLGLHTLFEAGYARLNIFKYNNILNYENILYLDTDILINSDMNVLFNLDIAYDKLYALEEGVIGHEYWGSAFFDFSKYDQNMKAFSTGVLLFKNSKVIESLFDSILLHILEYSLNEKNSVPKCLEQPFVVYNAITQNEYDNQLLKPYIENNPSDVNVEKIIYHFSGEPGEHKSKYNKMRYFWNKMNPIVAVTPTNVYDTSKMKYLLESAEENHFQVDIIGVNQEFRFFKKILLLKAYLEDLPKNINQIVCFTDAYDVFYSESLETIKNKFLVYGTDIVWSVEKLYSHQLESDKAFYDNLTNLPSCPYKYINTGTFIGYKHSLLRLLNDIDISIGNSEFMVELKREGWDLHSDYVDQTIISHHLAKHWNKYKIVLDTHCNIFYVHSEGFDNIENYMTNELVVRFSNKTPSIIHVPYKNKYESVLIQLFQLKYNMYARKIQNKKYHWKDDCLIFLEKDIIFSNIKGSYKQLDTYVFQAIFGATKYVLAFNDDYSEFVSVRQGDNEITKGKIK